VPPLNIPAGRFWLSTVPGEGFVALYGVCTHLGCLPKWVPVNNRFECPCHGSKYQKNGHYISGPAPRSLDRFKTVVTFEDGSTGTTNANGDPIPLNGKKIVSVVINTGARIKRAGRV
jgi:cytochrome b6-f complex iron-sulfur subunit